MDHCDSGKPVDVVVFFLKRESCRFLQFDNCIDELHSLAQLILIIDENRVVTLNFSVTVQSFIVIFITVLHTYKHNPSMDEYGHIYSGLGANEMQIIDQDTVDFVNQGVNAHSSERSSRHNSPTDHNRGRYIQNTNKQMEEMTRSLNVLGNTILDLNSQVQNKMGKLQTELHQVKSKISLIENRDPEIQFNFNRNENNEMSRMAVEQDSPYSANASAQPNRNMIIESNVPIRENMYRPNMVEPNDPMHRQTMVEPNAPIRENMYRQNMVEPNTQIRENLYRQDMVELNAPIRKNMYRQNMVELNAPIRENLYRQDMVEPNAQIRENLYRQNMVEPNAPIRQNIYRQNMIEPEAHIRENMYRQNLVEPNAPIRENWCRNEKPHSLKMKPQAYSGSDDLDDFLTQFEITAEINGWGYTDKSLYLASTLTHDARSLLSEMNDRERRDFDMLVEKLKARFGSENKAEVFRTQLKTRIRNKGETIPELAQSIRKMTRLAYPTGSQDVVEALALDAFIDALTDSEVRLRFRETGAKTLSEAEKMAVRMEAHRLADKQRNKLVGNVDETTHNQNDTSKQGLRENRTNQNGINQNFKSGPNFRQQPQHNQNYTNQWNQNRPQWAENRNENRTFGNNNYHNRNQNPYRAQNFHQFRSHNTHNGNYPQHGYQPRYRQNNGSYNQDRAQNQGYQNRAQNQGNFQRSNPRDQGLTNQTGPRLH